MKLIFQLAKIRDAAFSIDSVHNPSEIIELILQGNPYDLLFFERLEDPNWLPILRGFGLFSDLPIGEVMDDGTLTYPRSLALRGLLNLSKIVPLEVIIILEDLEIPVNPAIKDQLMGILAEIDEPSITNRVLKVASRTIQAQPYASLVWINEVLAKAVRHQCFDGVLEVVGTILAVILTAKEEHPRTVDIWQIGEIDRNILLPISEAKPLTASRVVFTGFIKWLATERLRQSASSDCSLDSVFESMTTLNEEDKPSSYWLEDFHGSVIETHDLESIFAYRLFSIGSQILRTNSLGEFDEFDTLLRSNRWNLFARLRWQLYADFPASTLLHARKDVLSRVLNAGRYSGSHGHEMAQMLEKHSEMHRDSFLRPDEVQTLCAIVQSGPFDYEDQLEVEPLYRRNFHRKQLHPIRCLLKDGDLEFFNSLCVGVPEIRPEAFKNFSSRGARMVENLAPKKAMEMPTMSDADLWNFLNHWVPSPKCPDPEKWWVEENVSELGVSFAELLESTPARFSASTEWWTNLTRPSVLLKPLDRATNQISEAAKSGTESAAPPSENDWRNWFGLASWITNQRTASHIIEYADQKRVELEGLDWNWPCIVVVRFLTTALGTKFVLPSGLLKETGRLLRTLVDDRDAILESKEKPWMDDWQTTAINSVRGTAVDGLLDLALFHKRHGGDPDPEGWIFDLIVNRLKLPNESPAVFAIFGSRLRLLLHLFGEKFESQPELLLPSDREELRNTLLLSHFCFDNPMTLVIATLPMLPDAAIECLAMMINEEEDGQEARGDFGGRLGTHLGFYYWNELFTDQATADAILDRYFAIAKPSHRGNFIRHIARVFAESHGTEDLRPLYKMVCELWDRRFRLLEQELADNSINPSDVHSELSAFIDWLGIEGLPFEWRHDRILRAIKHLEKAPGAGFTIKTLEKISSKPTRLNGSLQILNALMLKDAKELRWTYQVKYLKPIVLRGISSDDVEVKKLAEAAQEFLLRQGQFEYLELTPEMNASE